MKVQAENTPLVADFMGRRHNLASGEYHFKFPLSEIGQVLDIDFSGFTAQEKGQKIEVKLFYNKKLLDAKRISSFKMKNNLYVDNKLIDAYDTVYFNGTLSLQFIKSWIEMEIISGFIIAKNKKDYIAICEGKHDREDDFYRTLQAHKTRTHDIAIVGTCHQNETKKKYTPSLFNKLVDEYPDKSIINYSSIALNDWCILHNSLWLLDNVKVKNLLFTLNVGSFMAYRINIFDHVSYWPFLNAPSTKDFAYEQQIKLYRFNRRRLSMWRKILNAKLDLLLGKCRQLQVKPIIIHYHDLRLWHDKDVRSWFDIYRDNGSIPIDKRTQVTNDEVFAKIKHLIV